MDACDLYRDTGNMHALDHKVVAIIRGRELVAVALDELSRVGHRSYDSAVTHMMKQRDLDVLLSHIRPVLVVDNGAKK